MSLGLTLNKILMTAIGLGLIAVGIWVMVARNYMVGSGVIFYGLGSLFWSLTGGFIDISPRGQILYRLGVFSFIIGIAITIYFLSGYPTK